MEYALGKWPPDKTKTIWDGLPQELKDELALALAEACEDPWGRCRPRNPADPDDVNRLLITENLIVAVLVFRPPVGRVQVRSIRRY